MDDRNFKNKPPTNFDFSLTFEIVQNFFLDYPIYNVYKEKMFTIKIEDGRFSIFR